MKHTQAIRQSLLSKTTLASHQGDRVIPEKAQTSNKQTMNHSQEKIDLCNKEKDNDDTRCQHIILNRYQTFFEYFSRSENDQFGILIFENCEDNRLFMYVSFYSHIISLL